MAQCNYIVGIEDEETWNQYNRKTINIVPDTTNMTVENAYSHAYSRISNLVLGPDYFKPLADIIIRDNNTEYAIYWARIFKEHKHRNERDYFLNDMKNIVVVNATYDNLLLWVLDVCIYDDDIMQLFYESTLNHMGDKYCIGNLTYLKYIGVLNGDNFLMIRRHIALNNMDGVKYFVDTYNKYPDSFSKYDNYKHLDQTPMTIEEFCDGISDDIRMGVYI